MNVHVAAMRHFHKLSGLPPPTDDERVRAVVRGHRRHVGVRPAGQAAHRIERLLVGEWRPGGTLVGKSLMTAWNERVSHFC